MRVFFIWVTGTLLFMIVGGGIGSMVAPRDFGAFWGVVAGALAFTFFRLSTAPRT